MTGDSIISRRKVLAATIAIPVLSILPKTSAMNRQTAEFIRMLEEIGVSEEYRRSLIDIFKICLNAASDEDAMERVSKLVTRPPWPKRKG